MWPLFGSFWQSLGPSSPKYDPILPHQEYQLTQSQAPEFPANYVSLFFVITHSLLAPLKNFSRSIIEQNDYGKAKISKFPHG